MTRYPPAHSGTRIHSKHVCGLWVFQTCGISSSDIQGLQLVLFQPQRIQCLWANTYPVYLFTQPKAPLDKECYYRRKHQQSPLDTGSWPIRVCLHQLILGKIGGRERDGWRDVSCWIIFPYFLWISLHKFLWFSSYYPLILLSFSR